MAKIFARHKSNKPNKKENIMENKFTMTFGHLASIYINRERFSDKIYNDFCLDSIVSYLHDQWSKRFWQFF